MEKSLPGLGSQVYPHREVYTPQTNGKAERFIEPLLAEWAYVIAYQTSDERNCCLPRYLGIYIGNRCHVALGGLSPQQCLNRLLIA